MSTILKALRRLEKEKTRTDRPLREQVTGLGGGDVPEVGSTRRWPILLGGIVAGVVTGVALLFLSRGESPPLPPAVEPAPAVAEAPRSQPPAPPRAAAPRGRGMIQPIPPGQAPPANPVAPAAAPAAPVAPASPPPPVASDDVEVVDRGAPGPRLAPERAETAAPVATAEPAPGSVRPFRRPEPGAVPGPQRPVEAAPPEAPVEAPAIEAAEAPAATPALAKAPSRPPPPPADPFPALRVERTTWHPLAERRLAVVDVPGEGARELHEGDAVAGATVALIEPSGVVFRYEGREVRRKVGATPRPD